MSKEETPGYCPFCRSDNIEYLGEVPGTGVNVYFCKRCNAHFSIRKFRREVTVKIKIEEEE